MRQLFLNEPLGQYFDISYKNNIFFSYIRKLPYVSVIAPEFPIQAPVGNAVSYEYRRGDWKIDAVISFLKSRQINHPAMIIGVADYDERRKVQRSDNFIMTNRGAYKYFIKQRKLSFSIVSLECDFGIKRPFFAPRYKYAMLPDFLILENKNEWKYFPPLDINKQYNYAVEFTMPDDTSIYIYERKT